MINKLFKLDKPKKILPLRQYAAEFCKYARYKKLEDNEWPCPTCAGRGGIREYTGIGNDYDSSECPNPECKNGLVSREFFRDNLYLHRLKKYTDELRKYYDKKELAEKLSEKLTDEEIKFIRGAV